MKARKDLLRQLRDASNKQQAEIKAAKISKVRALLLLFSLADPIPRSEEQPEVHSVGAGYF
jgi:hypothetical protein